MSDIVSVVYNNDITATVSSENQTVVSAIGIQGAAGTGTKIEYSENVDATNLENGSLLIYNNITSLWVASRNLVAQNMDCGEF